MIRCHRFRKGVDFGQRQTGIDLVTHMKVRHFLPQRFYDAGELVSQRKEA